MTAQDRRTERVLWLVLCLSLAAWAGFAALALAQDRDHNREAREDLRSDMRADLAAHHHPDVPTSSELISGGGLLVLILGGLTLRVHQSQVARQDRHGKEIRALQTSHGDLQTAVGRIDGRLDSEMSWLHGELEQWRQAREETQRVNREAMESLRRLAGRAQGRTPRAPG